MSNIEWDCEITDDALEEACATVEASLNSNTKKRPLVVEDEDDDYFEGDELYKKNDDDDCALRHFRNKRLWRINKKFKYAHEPKMCLTIQELEDELYSNIRGKHSMWNHCPLDDLEWEYWRRDMDYIHNFYPIEREHLEAIEYEQMYMMLVDMWWNRHWDELKPDYITKFFMNKK